MDLPDLTAECSTQSVLAK